MYEKGWYRNPDRNGVDECIAPSWYLYNLSASGWTCEFQCKVFEMQSRAVLRCGSCLCMCLFIWHWVLGYMCICVFARVCLCVRASMCAQRVWVLAKRVCCMLQCFGFAGDMSFDAKQDWVPVYLTCVLKYVSFLYIYCQ